MSATWCMSSPGPPVWLVHHADSAAVRSRGGVGATGVGDAAALQPPSSAAPMTSAPSHRVTIHLPRRAWCASAPGEESAISLAGAGPGPRQPDERPASARERYHPSVRVERRLTPAQGPELRTGDLITRVVRRPDERPRLDVLEAERQRNRLHLGELVGSDVALDREGLERGPQ